MGVVIILFIVLRQVNLWYWKINYQVDIMNNIKGEIAQLNATNKANSDLIFLLLASNLSDKKIVLISRKDGQIRNVSGSEVRSLDLAEYDIEILHK